MMERWKTTDWDWLIAKRPMLQLALAMFLSIYAGVYSAAQETERGVSAFRIDTDLYENTSKPPISSSLTLYDRGVFYSTDGQENGIVTVIDPGRSRILLLDRKRMKKTELSTSEVESRIARLREEMSPQQAKLFAVTQGATRDPETGEIVVANESAEYRCTVQEAMSQEIAIAYADFADWSARLNAIAGPRRPPYMRMELNAAVLAENKIPKEIRWSVQHRGKSSVVTARLLFNGRLSTADEAKIAKIGAMIVQFPSESLDQFVAASANL